MSSSLTRSVTVNWIGLGARIVSGFILLPFVLRYTGPASYGIYLFLISIFGYGVLLDLGLSAVVTRYVSSLSASGDFHRLNRLLSAVFTFYGILCALLLLIALSVFLVPAHLMPNPQAEQNVAVLVFLATARTAFLFPQLGWIAVLRARERFDLSNILDFGALGLRIGLIVTLVPRGHGITALLFADLAEVLLSLALHAIAARRLFSDIRPRPFAFGREDVRAVTGYGSWVMLNSLAQQIRYRAHSIVIGTLLSAAAITMFGVAGRLQSYLVNVTNVMTTPIRARIGAYEGRGDWRSIRELYLRSFRLVSLVAMTLCLTFFLESDDFFRAWVGVEYAQSGDLMRILLPAVFLDMCMTVCVVTVYAVERHQRLTSLVFSEALAIVALSVAAAGSLGLTGVALANLLPVLLVRGFLLPRYAAATIELGLGHWFREGLFPSLLPGAIAIAPLLAVRAIWSSGGIFEVILRLVIEQTIVLLVAWKVTLREDDRRIARRFLNRIRRVDGSALG